MSGIYGLVDRQGGDAAGALATLRNAMDYWEPDRRATWHEGPVALGLHENWNTPEAAASELVLARRREDNLLVLCADLRLDNREELFGLLGKGHGLGPGDSDLEFLRAAYREWGGKCAARLLGDFSFAIWDQRDQSLFCARDPAGIKPFYYALDERRFTFANDMRCLRGAGWVPRKLDDTSLLRFLAESDLLAQERTFYRAVKRLPAAHSLLLNRDGLQLRPYWRPEDAAPVRHRNFEDYVEHARALLRDAVAVRMRSQRPRICSHLSGGIDSGIVAGIAAKTLPSGAPTLATFSWFASPVGGGDDVPELSRAARLARWLASEHRFIDLGVDDLERQLLETDLALMDATYPWYERTVIEQAAALGSGVVLSGWGGDELLSNPGRLAASELFLRGRWMSLFQELSSIANSRGDGSFPQWRLFKRGVLMPLLSHYFGFVPAAERSTLAAERARQLQFVGKAVLHEHAASLPGTPRLAATVRGDQLNFLASGHLQSRAESWSNLARAHKVEHRFPLLDRRVLEFALGLPREMYLQRGVDRRLFRAAAAGFVDEEARLGRLKAEPERVRQGYDLLGRAMVRAMRKQGPGDRSSCPLAIDPVRLQSAARAFVEGGCRVTSRVDAARFRALLNTWLVCRAEGST